MEESSTSMDSRGGAAVKEIPPDMFLVLIGIICCVGIYPPLREIFSRSHSERLILLLVPQNVLFVLPLLLLHKKVALVSGKLSCVLVLLQLLHLHTLRGD